MKTKPALNSLSQKQTHTMWTGGKVSVNLVS